MEYITGKEISTSSSTWTSGGGDLTVTLLRNAKLATNGYVPSAEHDIQVHVAGNLYAFWGAIEHPQHGYCIQLNMGKITARVPAEKQAEVKALLEEHGANNAAARKACDEDEAAYQAHRSGVLALLNK